MDIIDLGKRVRHNIKNVQGSTGLTDDLYPKEDKYYQHNLITIKSKIE